MILKKLYDDYDIDIDKIIQKDYKKLGLKYVEATMLLSLLYGYKKRKIFSISMLAKKTELKKEKVEEITYSLIEKGFMKLGLEINSEGKEREVYNLDSTFAIIEKYLIDSKAQEKSSLCFKTVEHLEGLLNRVLTDMELNTIRSWYEDGIYTHEIIEKAVLTAEEKNKLSIKVIEKFIIAESEETRVEIDEKTRKALHDIYTAIK